MRPSTFKNGGLSRALESREVEGLAGANGTVGRDTHLRSLTSRRHVQSPWKLRTRQLLEQCGATGSGQLLAALPVSATL